MRLCAPDWTNLWTAEVAERELSAQNFKFKGPGIYHHKGDTMIVIPVDRHHNRDINGHPVLWHQKFTANEVFEFNVFNGRDPSDEINLLIHAPNREDDR